MANEVICISWSGRLGDWRSGGPEVRGADYRGFGEEYRNDVDGLGVCKPSQSRARSSAPSCNASGETGSALEWVCSGVWIHVQLGRSRGLLGLVTSCSGPGS